MYTLLYQYANMSIGESYLAGQVTAQQATQKLIEFPWDEQLKQFQEEEGTSPTYWLKNSADKVEFMASLVSEDTYYLCFTENVTKRTLGLFPHTTKKNHASFGHSYEDVKRTLDFFLQGDFKAVLQLLDQKESVDSQL